MDIRDFGLTLSSGPGSSRLDLDQAYGNKRVLVTGGFGFLGSTLARRLVACGARVTVVDSLHPLYGGNPFNLRGLESDLTIVIGDLRDRLVIDTCVPEQDFVFHLAAQVSYIDSLNMPVDDLLVNAGVTLELLEACRRHGVKPRFVFASSRMVVGKADRPTLTEDTPVNPVSLYGVHKYACERYLAIYHQSFGIPTTSLRITNPYGPRQQIHHSKYSLVGWFVRQALENQSIRIFGDGEQTRDYVYVDDLAEAFLRCAAADAVGRVVNLGSGVTTRFRDMVCLVVDVVGRGRVEFVPWPKDYARLETGDVSADLRLLHQLTGWRSQVDLRTGIERTAEYYREHWRHYVTRPLTVELWPRAARPPASRHAARVRGPAKGAELPPIAAPLGPGLLPRQA
jgi:UDP-glucose 4-epimerase